MKKIISIILVALLTMSNTVQSNANTDQKVVAILDTYVDSSISDRIIHEVCTVLNSSCLNNSSFMEGKGAANVLPSDLSAKGIEHGPQMAAIALQANPNTKVVFIRIHNVNRYPNLNAIYASDDSIAEALKWVVKNASKYSIDSVSISQARTNFPKGSCPKNESIESSVQSLKMMSIPVFAGAGNRGWWDRTAFPACSTDVIGVGSSGKKFILGTSNMGIGVDFYSLGTVQLKSLNNILVVGTSVATAHIASVWINKYSGTWQEQYALANLSKSKVTQLKGKQEFIFIDN